VETPYGTLAQALRTLIRGLLTKPEAELQRLREALSAAVNPNGAVLVDLVPELELIIGAQPPVVELPAKEAQRGFQLLIQRFISVFARPEHPLALFLDDLQWLDAATLELLGELLGAGEVRHLLLIGAYRDNEVNEQHPLTKKLDELRQGGANVTTVTLLPLEQGDLEDLLGDALRAPRAHLRPLAELALGKTGGNPFFLIQFLDSLAQEGLLAFDHQAGHWSWDHERTFAKSYTDNVVELMLRKLGRLPAPTRQTLMRLACLGNVAEHATLSAACDSSSEVVDSELWEALRHELLLRTESAYRFSHDRVREAAYSLIPDPQRAALHLQIGRRLLERTPVERRKEAVFEIVNQLNRGGSLITLLEEREQLAELDLLAGKRAKTSTAYAAALEYLNAGLRWLPEDGWTRRRELTFSLLLARAECEYLTGDLAAAEHHLGALWARDLASVERAAVACLRIDLYVNLAQGGVAITAGLDYLRHVGIDWSARPTAEAVRNEYELVWATLGERPTETLIDLPLMRDPTHLGTLDVLITLTTPTWLVDPDLLFLVTCRAVNLSLTHGNADASCVAYVMFGALSGPRFGGYQAAHRFSLLAHRLGEQPDLRRFRARTDLFFGYLVLSWKKHLRVAREALWRSNQDANQVGNLTFAAISSRHISSNMLTAGDPLEEAQRQIEISLAFATERQFWLVVFTIIPQLGFARTLRGLTPTFGTFDDEQIDEQKLELQLASNELFAVAECFHWIRKLQARFLAGEHTAALEAASRAERLLWSTTAQVEAADYHFFAALTRAACCDTAAADELAGHRSALAAHYQQLSIWAEDCPENFESPAALVAAELTRHAGRDLEAMRLYDRAIHAAEANGFANNEAIAYELAGHFYARRGFEQFARLYLRNARRAYVRWGAYGKIRQLDGLYPQLREVTSASRTGTIATSNEQLDLATVLKVSQAVSSEIVLEKLIDALMRAAIEHAGAERGLLVLVHGDTYRIEAEAIVNRGMVHVNLLQAEVSGADLPESVFHYVLRTRESVLLHDACADERFAADDYVRQHRARSVLCLPLLKQARVVGVLHLENNLSTDVFTPGRITVLKLLASEAATSLENCRLYRVLEEREARVRRLVDSNVIGIFIADFAGQIVDANPAFLATIGYDRDDLVAGRLRWTELTPSDWHQEDEKHVAELAAKRVHEPYEKEFFRKDGTRVPILLGTTLFDDGTHGVCFVLDLTERKQAEHAARESDRRYHEIRLELSHANRVATVGQLSASITHELNQPLSGILTNAALGVRLLEGDAPNLEGARETARRTLRDANRAVEVIRRLRGLFSKTNATIEPLDLNETIREVVALTVSELRSRRIALHLELSDGLPHVHGDRIQLQQVMLNLIKNAMDAMSEPVDEPQHLRMSSAQLESQLLVVVEDSGPGVPAADLERIFDAFYSTKSDGLGVGLSICRAIIEAHRGQLSHAPAAPHGAAFRFTLPTSAAV
jgi:PAS domain S-box-containing protein